jgi:hypothetical protein
MKFKDFIKITEADDNLGNAAVKFTDGTTIIIRNIPKAATEADSFEAMIRAAAQRAKPDLSFASWSPVQSGASGSGYTPSSEEEIDMNNCLELAEHVRSRSKSITPFTFTDSSGDTDTIENPNETLNVDEAYNSTYNKFVELQENIIEILNAGKNIFYGQPPRPKREPGEPLAIGIGGDKFQYRNSIVPNLDDL